MEVKSKFLDVFSNPVTPMEMPAIWSEMVFLEVLDTGI